MIKKTDVKQKDVNKAQLSNSVLTDEELVREVSIKLINSFGKKLKGELMAAMKEDGALSAINTCAEVAPQIEDQYSTEFWQIKRVSDKQRRTSNKTDEHEQEILLKFAVNNEEGISFYDEWIESDSGKFYYYYKPLRIGKLCLNCHGNSEDIPTKVKEALNEQYPEDMAIGYKAGDLRGMFVVKAKWSDGKEFAEELNKTEK